MRGKLQLTFYGDDFTGSTDVLESLAREGLRAVLFLRPPDARTLRRYPGLQALGVAGTSRTMTAKEMSRALPPIFRALKRTGAPVVHYKVCSTFDSSPRIGSIGRALELGMGECGSRFVPVVVGAPGLGRYCVFGNLFARSGLDSPSHRLDRHPTMRVHPTTPMDEADLRMLLGKQTRVPIGLVDVLALDRSEAGARVDAMVAGGCPTILFDLLNAAQLERIGEVIWKRTRSGQPLFAVGSSGLEYALLAWWRKSGLLKRAVPRCRLKPVRTVAVVSGSCSPVTDRQIERALAAGFAEVRLDTAGLVRSRTRAGALGRACEAAAAHLQLGRSVILHTARGPHDARLARTSRWLRARGERSAAVLGAVLGELLERLSDAGEVTRGAVTGGDTSGFAARAMGLEALEFTASVAPGAPLCVARAPGRVMDGRELVFKGGQNGRDDFFITLLRGAEPPWGSRQSENRIRKKP